MKVEILLCRPLKIVISSISCRLWVCTRGSVVMLAEDLVLWIPPSRPNCLVLFTAEGVFPKCFPKTVWSSAYSKWGGAASGPRLRFRDGKRRQYQDLCLGARAVPQVTSGRNLTSRGLGRGFVLRLRFTEPGGVSLGRISADVHVYVLMEEYGPEQQLIFVTSFTERQGSLLAMVSSSSLTPCSS